MQKFCSAPELTSLINISSSYGYMKMQKLSIAFNIENGFNFRESFKTIHFLGLSPKQRTPPTHPTGLGLPKWKIGKFDIFHEQMMNA